MKNTSRSQPRTRLSLKLSSPHVMLAISPSFKPLTSRARLLPLTRKPSVPPALIKQSSAPDMKKVIVSGTSIQENEVSASARGLLGDVDILPEIEQGRAGLRTSTLSPQQLADDVILFQRELLRTTVKGTQCKFWDPQDSLTLELYTLMLPVRSQSKAVLQRRETKRTQSRMTSLAPLRVLGGPSPLSVIAHKTSRASLHEIIASRLKKAAEFN